MEEQIQQSELSLTDAVSSLVAELPKPIQEFIRGPERDQIAIKLAEKYKLHVDQAGIFQLAYLHMLIGVSSPEEFVKTLKEGGISQDVVTGLTNDVNEMVFKPLREKEREGSVATTTVLAPKSTPPLQTAATPVPSLEQTAAPYAGARPQPLTPFNLPGADARPDDLFRASTRTVGPVQASSPISQPVQAPITPPIPTPLPPITLAPAHMPVERISIPAQPVRAPREEALGGTLRTMATDMLAVNEHREPEPVQYKGTVLTPPMLREKVSEMNPVSPKSSSPLPPPVSMGTNVPPSIRPVVRPTVTLSPSSELIKEYSSDPYREPV